MKAPEWRSTDPGPILLWPRISTATSVMVRILNQTPLISIGLSLKFAAIKTGDYLLSQVQPVVHYVRQ